MSTGGQRPSILERVEAWWIWGLWALSWTGVLAAQALPTGSDGPRPPTAPRNESGIYHGATEDGSSSDRGLDAVRSQEGHVWLKSFVVDGELMPLTDRSLRIAPGKKDFAWDFAVASALAPSKVQVLYRLQGFDARWVDAKEGRTARYTYLQPGQYTFEVRAANNHGKWDPETASIQFRVLPSFYQAPGFRWVLVLLGAWGLLQLWVRWHRSVAAQAAGLSRDLRGLEVNEIFTFMQRRVFTLEPAQAIAILERVEGSVVGRDVSLGELKCRLVGGVRDLFERSLAARKSLSRAAWHDLSDSLRSGATWSNPAEFDGLDEGNASILTTVNDVSRLQANILRAESVEHLAAVQDDLINLWALPHIQHLGHPEFLNHLVEVWGDLDQIHRLPSPEDRTLFLARALTKVLVLKEMLEVDKAAPHLGLELKLLTLVALRQTLTRELQEGRHHADLSVELNSHILTTHREAVITLTIKNQGQGPARGLLVELLPSAEHFRSIQHHYQIKSLVRQQAARIEFLVEPKVSDRVRLTFRLTYDDLESQGHSHEFADVIEFRQVPTRLTFQPLRPNPYVIGRPLMESDIFIGREEIFARLRASLQGVNQDNVLVLMGSRRMGKTSILRRLQLHLSERYVPILVDLQGMIGSGESAFFRELVVTLCDDLEEAGFEVTPPSNQALDRDPGTVFRRQFLKETRRTLRDRRLLLIFDEFEVLEERIRSGDLKPQILTYFRSLMQHEKHISFIFAGTHRLDELTRDYWGALFNLAVYLEVGHLSEKESHQLFLEPTDGYFEIDPLALDKAFQITGGHPHFSQLLARELVEFRNLEKTSYVTIQDINHVAQQVAGKGQLHISYLWEEGSLAERQILLILKDLLDRKGLATFHAIQRYLTEHRVPVHDPMAALKLLIRREILQDNAGLLSFRIDLLRLWLDRQPELSSYNRVGGVLLPETLLESGEHHA